MTCQTPGSINFSPDARYLQYYNKTWSIDTGQRMFPDLEDRGWFKFSAEGRLALNSRSPMVWDTTILPSMLRFGIDGNYSTIMFTKDGGRIVTVDVQANGELGDTIVWESSTGKKVLSLGKTWPLRDSLDGSAAGAVVLAQGAGGSIARAALLNILTGKSMPFNSDPDADQRPTVSPDGKFVVDPP